ncbi:hypothetical protein ALC57_04059, partial [Trachymyrmex cornetzi]
NVKLYLNSTFYPYDDLNLGFGKAENDDNKALVYVKGREKREWLADVLDNDNLTIETLDADYKDIDSLHNLDVTNTMRSVFADI